MKPTRFFTAALAISGLAAMSAQPALAKNIPRDFSNIAPPEMQADDNANAGVRADFQKLREQHAADLDRAEHDLNVRYADQLNALLIKAAQAKDYRAVSAINEMLKATIFGINHSEVAKKELSDWLMANDFTWVDDFANGHPRYHFKFFAKTIGGDPDVAWVDTSSLYKRWEAVSGDEVCFPTAANGSQWSLYFYVDRNTKTFTLDKVKTPQEHQDKEILFGDQTNAEKAENQPSLTTKLPSEIASAKDIPHYFSRIALPAVQIDDNASANAEVRADFQKLREQHAMDLDRAAHDLNVRYADQLNALLIKAAQAKDYFAVSEINQTLEETVYAINHSEMVKKELGDWLMANDWTWGDDWNQGHPRLRFKFTPDGIDGGHAWEISPQHDFHEWKAISGNEIQILNTPGQWYLYFYVNRDTKTITLDTVKTPKEHQDKEILFGDQTNAEKAESQPSATTIDSSSMPQPTIQK